MKTVELKRRERANSAFEKAYAKLNPEQKKAVDTTEGPVLVVAGPGSGKTQILSLRVANILLQTDMRPSNILCLTFTDSAAANMRERLGSLIGHDAHKVCIHTFHSFCTDIIGKYPEYFYNGSSFVAADELTQLETLEKIFKTLPYDAVLRKEHPEEGFIYLKPVQKAISELKRAGLSPKEFKIIVNENEKSLAFINACVASVFGERVSMKIVGDLRKCVADLRSHKSPALPVEYVRPLAHMIASSLDRAITDAVTAQSSSPLSVWKQQWTRKNDDGRIVFKDSLYTEKMTALAHVYERYVEDMYKAGYFDFEDMILDVICALERHAPFRSELEEQYQYILLDEFQDTNDAQLRLLRNLTRAAVHEQKPNIMVVGDDDQAIYKFQGAEVSNMLNFQSLFGDASIIVLKNNYRSTQHILDVARHIILQGEDRLEKVLPELSKELVAAKGDAEGKIESHSFPSPMHEYAWVAREAKRRIEAGAQASEIAIIARSHNVLEALVPFLHKARVPVSYERQQDVFEETHIRQLILMARFSASLLSKHKEEADEFLPEILSFPFWKIDRKVVWKISIEASESRRLWLDVMLEHEDERMRRVAEFFIDVSHKARHEPLERILDMLIGSHVDLVSDDEDADTLSNRREDSGEFVSPFKDFYFSREIFAENKVGYLTFLSSLRTFVEALREYRKGRKIFIDDLVSFVDLHNEHGIAVTDQNPFANGSESVKLLSAHKAKGLEFDTVFVLSCQHDIWARRSRASLVPFPMNVPISPAGDTDDDHLRLFYVALTRARRDLVLTSYETDVKGRMSERFGFLHSDSALPHVKNALTPNQSEISAPDSHEALVSQWESYNRPPFVQDEEALLKNLVEDYQMSVTHLNNFLDVTRGGPNVFLEQNLLQFPQAKTPASSFGTAMHAALERIYFHIKTEGKKPTLPKIISWFEESLSHERMSSHDFKLYRDRGEAALRLYVEKKRTSFSPSSLIEVNFKHQGVKVGEARLTGKIDKLEKQPDGTYLVCDFKTGGALLDWEGHTPHEKVKTYRYRRQLLFYKILVEGSRDFEGAAVREGVLEFLEPHKNKIVDLKLEINQQEVDRLRRLVEVVYAKICALDFPDTEKYPQDCAGIRAFEDDLLASWR